MEKYFRKWLHLLIFEFSHLDEETGIEIKAYDFCTPVSLRSLGIFIVVYNFPSTAEATKTYSKWRKTQISFSMTEQSWTVWDRR